MAMHFVDHPGHSSLCGVVSVYEFPSHMFVNSDKQIIIFNLLDKHLGFSRFNS